MTSGGILLAFAAALLGAKLLGEAAERIGQPAVLGEILAGVLLGPSVLGWVSLSSGLLLLAEIGVVLLLFEVGLETDLPELLRVGVAAARVAVVGMILPFAGGLLLTRSAGHSWVTAIFVGAALTATSVGITARVLSELRVLETREGRIILGAAVLDDVLGLVLLAIVGQIAAGTAVNAGSVARSTALALGFLVVAILLGIPLGRRLVAVVSRASVRGVLVTASVGLALLMAAAAKAAGSAEIVGAFACGLVLARTNRRHDIDTALKPVVDIFAPIFFVAVGAQVDLQVLAPSSDGNRAMLLAVGLTAVAFAGKFGAGYVAGRDVSHAFIGAGMVPRGEVGLIFASVGRSSGALSPSEFAAVVLAVLATTFLAPPLLKILRPRPAHTARPEK
jgi:Kef-type K+ transport system membrane component KefB